MTTSAAPPDRGVLRRPFAERPHQWWWIASPALLALVLSTAWSWRPSYWRDETSTVSAAVRPIAALPHLLRHVDAVHGLYYALLHPLAQIGVDSWWLRLPSALATAGTAALIAVLGRQLVDRRTGVAAAVLWSMLPISSRYGMDARSVALGVLVSVGATVVLVGAVRRGGRRWWIGYTLLVALGGYLFLFSILALAGHAVVIVSERADGARLIRPFTLSAAAAAALISPLAFLSIRESAQLSWMTRPTLGGSVSLIWTLWFGPKPLAGAMWLMVGAAIVLAIVAWRRGGRRLLAVGLAGAGVPPVILLAASQLHPLFVDRYVASGAAYISLLAGYALTRLPGRLGVVGAVAGAVVVAVLAAGTWKADRAPGAWQEEPDRLASIMTSERQPGDEVVFQPTFLRSFVTAYPSAFSGLPDVTIGETPNDSGTLGGLNASHVVIGRRLSTAKRLWLWRDGRIVSPSSDDGIDREAMVRQGFTITRTWNAGWSHLDLLERH